MTRQMIDSAFPLVNPPACDIILIYAGGDTVHPWTTAEILAMPARYRWPCWVRSNPQQVNAGTDAAAFITWLQHHKVPKSTCVILDLEIAVDGAYVNAFNTDLRAAGYKVTKYGSQDFIWSNPKKDGGTYVALPGLDVLTTEGDTVARQYAFLNGFDRSIAKDQADLPLWDTKPTKPPKPPARKFATHVTGGELSMHDFAAQILNTPAHILRLTADHYGGFPPEVAAWLNRQVFAPGHNAADPMPAGLHLRYEVRP